MCEYCGLEIQEQGQRCPALDDAACSPVPDESEQNYCAECGAPLNGGDEP